MYSYGSSARGATGKRGHGGRNYRPPPERRDPTTTPPPLRECSCLLELNLIEYSRKCGQVQQDGSHDNSNGTATNTTSRQQQHQQGRQHLCFGGRHGMEYCQKELRRHRVHLIIPGKNQAGPLSIVAKTHHDAIPAAEWLLRQLNLSLNTITNDNSSRNNNSDIGTTSGNVANTPEVATTRQNQEVTEESNNNDDDESVTGRIILNVKHHSVEENTIHGIFIRRPTTTAGFANTVTPLVPCWFFRSITRTSSVQDWCILSCALIQYKYKHHTRSSLPQDNGRRGRRHGICFEYQRTGQCRRGNQCRFLHEATINEGDTNDNEDDFNLNLSSTTNETGIPENNATQATTAVAESGTDLEKIEESLAVLHTCIDNLQFRLGRSTVGKLDIFMDSQGQTAFASGTFECLNILSQEIKSTVHNSSE